MRVKRKWYHGLNEYECKIIIGISEPSSNSEPTAIQYTTYSTTIDCKLQAQITVHETFPNYDATPIGRYTWIHPDIYREFPSYRQARYIGCRCKYNINLSELIPFDPEAVG